MGVSPNKLGEEGWPAIKAAGGFQGSRIQVNINTNIEFRSRNVEL
jgi:hypothetical protein